MVKKETDGGEVHVWTLAGWPCGLSGCRACRPVSLVAHRRQNKSVVPCWIAWPRVARGLNHFRLANDGPQNYPRTG